MIKGRVRLIRMEDPYTNLKKGDEGTIQGEDGSGHVLVKWDNGSSLSLLPDIDEYEVLENRFIKTFESFSPDTFIESKLEEIGDLVGSFKPSHFDWIVRGDIIECEIDVPKEDVRIRWEIDLKKMQIEESTIHRGKEDIWFDGISSIDEAIDIIEKEIHYWLDISENKREL